MTDKQWQDLKIWLNYASAIVLGVIVAGGTVMLGYLQSGQPIDWTPVIAAALSSFLTAARAAMLPQVGADPKPLAKGDVGRIADAIIERRQGRKS